ncbi:MAG: hypothetical protein OEY63_05865, partial [Gemmatimonadota bacterium]|nr:hypothetical protein [Gemmatimonadota bacterium]
MKIFKYYIFVCLVSALALGSCTSQEKEKEAPAASPEQVVLKFYSLLAQGGKLTLKEAHGMVSGKFGPVDPDSFRKWVQNFEKGTKIKIVDTKVPKEK